jgi:hypothetical protein
VNILNDLDSVWILTKEEISQRASTLLFKITDMRLWDPENKTDTICDLK